MKHFRKLAAMCMLAAAFPAAGNASVVMNIEEIGGDVVASYSGSIYKDGLIFEDSDLMESYINGAIASIRVGEHYNNQIFSGFSGPSTWGSGTIVFASSTSGDFFGIDEVYGYTRITLPFGYRSGGALSGSATFAGETLAYLGLNPGQYVYAAGDQTVTVNIGTVGPGGAVPEPATWALMLVGFAMAGGALRRRPPVAPPRSVQGRDLIAKALPAGSKI